MPNGPAPIAFLPVIQRMEEVGACSWEERSYFHHTQKRLVAQRNPDLTQFSKEQLKLVDHLIERFWNVSARDVSEASHELPSWSAFGMQEEIFTDRFEQELEMLLGLPRGAEVLEGLEQVLKRDPH